MTNSLSKSALKIILLSFLLITTISISWAEERKVLHLEVKTEKVPLPQITLSWDKQQSNAIIVIYRRVLDDKKRSSSWGKPIATVRPPYRLYKDSDVNAGIVYEYKIFRPKSDNNHENVSMYITSGIEAPLIDNRGKILLVVDNTIAKPLSVQLERLEHDLAGDGWTVIRYDSPRHGRGIAESLKNWIIKKYKEDTVNTKMLFLLGHLPIVKSGYQAPDGHNPQPHATDLFYSDINGKWTDSTLNIPKINVPSDGIYDQNTPSDYTVELQVGRVDFADMSAWNKSEVELLDNYLRKDHLWRHGIVKDARNAIIAKSTMVSSLSMEHGMLHSLYHTKDINEVDSLSEEKWVNWNREATKASYTWGVVFGDYKGKNYPSYNFKVAFSINFGSLKQQWAMNNNPMRAMLAMPEYGLVSAWGSRPYWFFHHMGMGKTIGYSAFRTQNNYTEEYSPAGSYSFKGSVHVNLMGDPSLRLYAVPPASKLSVSSDKGVTRLEWTAAASPVQGYHVYKATDMRGPFTRLSSSLIQSTNFVDNTVSKGTNHYMVRAVRLEQTPSGTFYNPSQGVFVSNSFKD
ncbi:MAG: hypothetical protein L3J59_10030 [Methylococcaceae bacterium]|nr:hypothetical protein [Methylococcaceae bacterium]